MWPRAHAGNPAPDLKRSPSKSHDGNWVRRVNPKACAPEVTHAREGARQRKPVSGCRAARRGGAWRPDPLRVRTRAPAFGPGLSRSMHARGWARGWVCYSSPASSSVRWSTRSWPLTAPSPLRSAQSSPLRIASTIWMVLSSEPLAPERVERMGPPRAVSVS